MARPHIEFIQAQRLPWLDNDLGTGRAGVRAKVLSRDSDSGEVSAIMQVPPRWDHGPEILAVDEEFFVLDGQIEHIKKDGTVVIYSADTYGFWPKGFPRGRLSSSEGGTVLTFLAGPVTRQAKVGFDQPRLVEKVDLRVGDWKADLNAMGLTVMAAAAKIRRLRSDPQTGEITYVTATMPFWSETQPERHPVTQEIFVLAGEISGNTGVMCPGAYTWRPPYVTHGPYGSRTGAVFFFRSRGGTLTTVHDDAVPFSYEVPHQPVLPPELKPLGAPYPRAERY